jgi:hypothetical protein
MKTWIIWLVCVLCTPLSVYALDCSAEKPCTFFWNANTEADLEGYRFYVKQVNGTYGPPLDIKQPQSAIGVEQFKASFGSLSPGNYVAAVSAYDKAGNESGKSNEVTFTFVVPDLPPAVPTLQILVTVP